MRKAVKEPKYITTGIFEKSMRAIAQSFQKVFDRLDNHDKKLEIILREIQSFREEARDHRTLLSHLSQSEIMHERRLEGLEFRIEKLEDKVKIR